MPTNIFHLLISSRSMQLPKVSAKRKYTGVQREIPDVTVPPNRFYFIFCLCILIQVNVSVQRLLHLYLDDNVSKISKIVLSLQSDFQTLITQKWHKISISFVHILKIQYSELRMALVSCLYLNASFNNCLLKKNDQKVEFFSFLKMATFQQF